MEEPVQREGKEGGRGRKTIEGVAGRGSWKERLGGRAGKGRFKELKERKVCGEKEREGG